MKHQHKNQRGFTLLETATVAFIFMLITIALYTVYSNYTNLLGQQEALIDTAGSVNAIMSDIHSSVLQADQVMSSHTFSGTAYTSTTTSLVLELPAISSSGDILVGKFDYIGYYSSSTTFYRIADASASSSRQSSTRSLSRTLKSITFSYNNGDVTMATSTTVSATTTETVKQTTSTGHIIEQMYLRNI